jgi:hypothetical protein
VAKEVPTIDDVIKRKIEKAKNWEKANPGLSWCDSGYAQDEPKIYYSNQSKRAKAFNQINRGAR